METRNNPSSHPPSVLPPVGPHGPPAGHPLVTPGWNDPPPISSGNYTAGSKRILNKRVAFPLSSNQSVPHAGSGINQSLDEVLTNMRSALSHLPPGNLHKDIDRISANWNEATCTDNIKELILQASRYLKNKDLNNAQIIHKELSGIPAAGWFALFLHSILNLYK